MNDSKQLFSECNMVNLTGLLEMYLKHDPTEYCNPSLLLYQEPITRRSV